MMEPNKYLIEWLKFAEARNAALLAGNLAVIFGVSKIEMFSSAAWDENEIKTRSSKLAGVALKVWSH